MAIKTVTVGAGTLTLAVKSGDGAKDFSSQITSARFEPEASKSDPILVLSGETIASADSFGGRLSVEFLQDLSTNGIVDYSFTNAGKEADFVYTPNTANKAKLAGTVIIEPLPIGDAVGDIAKASVSWQVPSLPRFTPGS